MTAEVSIDFNSKNAPADLARGYIELLKLLAENRTLNGEDLIRLAGRVPGLTVGIV